jgi:hypothetical protein
MASAMLMTQLADLLCDLIGRHSRAHAEAHA